MRITLYEGRICEITGIPEGYCVMARNIFTTLDWDKSLIREEEEDCFGEQGAKILVTITSTVGILGTSDTNLNFSVWDLTPGFTKYKRLEAPSGVASYETLEDFNFGTLF